MVDAKSDRTSDILAAVRGWARANNSNPFCNFYLFGSLVNTNGEYFAAEGGIESDVDILVRFTSEDHTAVDRLNALKALKLKVEELEQALDEINKKYSDGARPRRTPWLSVLPITEFEIYHSVHKGHDPEIICTDQFYDLSSDEISFVALSDYIDHRFHQIHVEYLSAIKMTQKIRNNYLKSGRVTEFSGISYAFPKEFMRVGALVNFARKQNKKQRTDLEVGQQFLSRLVEAEAQNCANPDDQETLNDLRDISQSRSSTVRASKPLTAEHQILLSEIIFDYCVRSVPFTLRQAITELTKKYTG